MKKKQVYKGQNIMVHNEVHALLVSYRDKTGVPISRAADIAIKAWFDANRSETPKP